jgi:hypothetical protein
MTTAILPATAEMRKVRFQSIEGIDRADLPLAYEVWLEEVYKATWATRETMKLAAYLVRYMVKPEHVPMTPADIETTCQLNAEEARKMLTSMRGFGVIDSYVYDRKQILIELNLSFSQRLRVLEIKHRFGHLARNGDKPWHLDDEKTPAAAAKAA